MASTTLAQTQAQLAMNTRGATAGRMAADKLAAQAQADAAQMMAAQDMAQRQAAHAPSGYGFMPTGPYMRSSQDDQAAASGGVMSTPYGSTAYGAAPYGSVAYGTTSYGTPPSNPALAPSGGSSMGYTLPQAAPRQ